LIITQNVVVVPKVLSSEDLLEVISGDLGELLLSGGVGAIRDLQMSNDIFSSSLDNGMMEEGGISVTRDCPVLFISLAMESLLLSKDGLVLIDELFLG
jgi:hypothetical protein